MIINHSTALHFLFSVVPKSNLDRIKKDFSSKVLFYDFEILDLSYKINSRNKNFLIKNDNSQTYILLKQPKSFFDDNIQTITKESYFYQFLNRCFNPKTFKEYIPKCYYFDENRKILVRQYGAEFQTFYDLKKHNNVINIVKKIGESISVFHTNLIKTNQLENWFNYFDSNYYPSVLLGTLRQNEFAYRIKKDENRTRLLDNLLDVPKEVETEIQKVRTKWQENSEGLIHGDIKSTNILSDAKNKLWIIDWELVSMGDPAWDLGCIISEFHLMYFSIGLYAKSLNNIKNLTNSLLAEYNPKLSEDFKNRVIAYTGIKLLEFAWLKLEDKNERKSFFIEFGIDYILKPQNFL